MKELKDTMSKLQRPAKQPLIDRDTMMAVDDITNSIMQFRGLNMYSAELFNKGKDNGDVRQSANDKIWMIVYYAMRLYKHCYEGSKGTPHVDFEVVNPIVGNVFRAEVTDEMIRDDEIELLKERIKALESQYQNHSNGNDEVYV